MFKGTTKIDFLHGDRVTRAIFLSGKSILHGSDNTFLRWGHGQPQELFDYPAELLEYPVEWKFEE